MSSTTTKQLDSLWPCRHCGGSHQIGGPNPCHDNAFAYWKQNKSPRTNNEVTIMEAHEAAKIFPISEETIDELAEDIKANGKMQPNEVMNGKILDGRRRHRACIKAGVTPKYKEVSVSDPVKYVLSLNLHRRHLSPTQLAMVGARVREIYDEQAKERQRDSGGDQKRKIEKAVVENFPQPLPDSQRARDAAGQSVGVSGKSIDHATKVLRSGTPSLIAIVEADKVAVSTAQKIASLTPNEQDAFVDRIQSTPTHHRKRPRPAEDDCEETTPDTNGKTVIGKGIILANEAINCLIRIPKNDGLRKRGFQVVTDWIKANK